ncbi:helix-turn-helix domain-containing protein [Kaistia sp. MMO-174]|uniref:helix-turn-helix domain-containing protein n=1 Tax=Kaistia sp. MMO-174 TaxID=3081256 RepID=UPI0030195865
MNIVLSQAGWHRADIIAAIHKKGSSLTRLGLANGFAATTLRSSLHRRHPKAHAIIAAFLGISQAELWPHWYASPDRYSSTHSEPARSDAAPSSQFRGAA